MGRGFMRRQIILLALYIGVVALVPGEAAATTPQVFHDTFRDTFSGVDCGIRVNVALFETATAIFYSDNGARVTGSTKITYTNPVNGQSMIRKEAFEFTTNIIEDDVAGTITFASTVHGLRERIQTDGGSVLYLSAGNETITETFDASTGELIDFEEKFAGPHPDELNDKSFCRLFTDALT